MAPTNTAKQTAKTAPAKKQAAKRAAKRTTAQAEADAEALHAGDDLPLVVVKGKARPRARLQLGEAGKIYIVTRPKEAHYWDLVERIGTLQGLASAVAESTTITPDQIEGLEQAKETLRMFVTSVFAKDDHAEVLAHLSDNDNDEQIDDLADAMTQLMTGPWAPETDEA